mmetsp:Transcript_2968/g.8975  ORF Transcript_2968/g.8975 Transcript_2968/m.8975 type:complete len:311 (+) Transcript_2968:518-1450(+)
MQAPTTGAAVRARSRKETSKPPSWTPPDQTTPTSPSLGGMAYSSGASRRRQKTTAEALARRTSRAARFAIQRSACFARRASTAARHVASSVAVEKLLALRQLRKSSTRSSRSSSDPSSSLGSIVKYSKRVWLVTSTLSCTTTSAPRASRCFSSLASSASPRGSAPRRENSILAHFFTARCCDAAFDRYDVSCSAARRRRRSTAASRADAARRMASDSSRASTVVAASIAASFSHVAAARNALCSASSSSFSVSVSTFFVLVVFSTLSSRSVCFARSAGTSTEFDGVGDDGVSRCGSSPQASRSSFGSSLC